VEEIFANKLCALLSRSEIRDLVDVRQLERSGLSLDDALKAAEKKDSGLTTAQLAWVLSQIELGDQTQLPGDVSVEDLKHYLEELINTLRRLALP
jgi:predicted nucleotidyltransferase component of viral defense system